MKNFFKGLIVGMLMITILTSTILAASGVTIEVLTNQINVSLNGTVVGKANENYTLSNGNEVPYSILYQGTTYLPLRKVAETLDMEVTWDGNTQTAGLNEKTETVVVEETPVVEDTKSTTPKNVNEVWIVDCNLSDLPVTIDAYNGMSVTINSLVPSTSGVLMNITMKNNSSVSDKGDPMVSTWEFYDGTRTLEDVSIDRIFYDTNYLRSGQEISGNIGYQGMTAGSETLILYGGLWQYIDREEIKVIIDITK